MSVIKDITQIKTKEELMERAGWLRGKTLEAVDKAIKENDEDSSVLTKGSVGHGIEKGFFGIKKNSDANPDIEHLGIEIKTCPLKYNKDKTKLSIKEPLSLNIINYIEEISHQNLKESSLYKKNKTILFIFYIHDNDKKSKRKQPFSDIPAEIRAFRLKNKYMNLIVSRHLGKKLKQGGWDID